MQVFLIKSIRQKRRSNQTNYQPLNFFCSPCVACCNIYTSTLSERRDASLTANMTVKGGRKEGRREARKKEKEKKHTCSAHLHEGVSAIQNASPYYTNRIKHSANIVSLRGPRSASPVRYFHYKDVICQINGIMKVIKTITNSFESYKKHPHTRAHGELQHRLEPKKQRKDTEILFGQRKKMHRKIKCNIVFFFSFNKKNKHDKSNCFTVSC